MGGDDPVRGQFARHAPAQRGDQRVRFLVQVLLGKPLAQRNPLHLLPHPAVGDLVAPPHQRLAQALAQGGLGDTHQRNPSLTHSTVVPTRAPLIHRSLPPGRIPAAQGGTGHGQGGRGNGGKAGAHSSRTGADPDRVRARPRRPRVLSSPGSGQGPIGRVRHNICGGGTHETRCSRLLTGGGREEVDATARHSPLPRMVCLLSKHGVAAFVASHIPRAAPWPGPPPWPLAAPRPAVFPYGVCGGGDRTTTAPAPDEAPTLPPAPAGAGHAMGRPHS